MTLIYWSCTVPLHSPFGLQADIAERKHPHIVSIFLSATGSALSVLRQIEWCYSDILCI